MDGSIPMAVVSALGRAVAPDEGVEFSGQTLLFVILGAVALIVVSMLGPISRIFDNRAERRREEAARAAEVSAEDPADG